MKRRGCTFRLFFALMMISGCTGLVKTTPDLAPEDMKGWPSPELLLRIAGNSGADINAFKAIGKIRLDSPNGKLSARGALCGTKSGNLRFDILNVTGGPLFSFSHNGSSLYYLSYGQGNYYKLKHKNPSLEKIIAIPVTPGEISMLLSGSFPISPWHKSHVEPCAGGDGWVLVLKKKWRAKSTRIYFDNAMQPWKIERYDPGGRVEFQAVFEEMQTVNGLKAPEKLKIKSKTLAEISFDLSIYKTNPDINDSIFILTKPGKTE